VAKRLKLPVMDLTIKTSANQNLLLRPGASAGAFYELPGSCIWSSISEHGIIHYQEIILGNFTLRYSFFQFFKKITLYFKMENPQAGVRIAIENRWNVALHGENSVTVLKNNFILFFPGNKGERIVFEKGQQYRGIEILCEPAKMIELMKVFPGTDEFLTEGEKYFTYLQKKPLLAPDQALDIILDNVEFTTIDRLSSFLTCILQKVEHMVDEMMPTTEEIKAVRRAEELIMKDFSVHYRIPEIARKVKLNEYRLKYVFRYIFKESIFKYQLIARLEKGKWLLQNTKKPLEAIAKAIGYLYLTSFITAFNKHFGYTPRSVRRPGK
jgi:AraC-like DNA-binding protein